MATMTTEQTNELAALRAENARLREALEDCTVFVSQAVAASILNEQECEPLLEQWRSALAEKGAR